MDLTPTKSADTENDTPPHSQIIKPFLSFTNGLAKHHHLHHQQPVVVTYKECLKNHAASLGGHALDGCGEFMPSPSANTTDPTSLKCAACGCHRNFHRREPDDSSSPPYLLDFRRHHYTPPLKRASSGSPSPPPPPPSYAPQMLLALNSTEEQQGPVTPTAFKAENLSGRKRFRTKFTQEQKEKMQSFSEKLGWKLQKCDESMVVEFCNEIGITKGVLKVWMHNNKNTLGKRDISSVNGGGGGGGGGGRANNSFDKPSKNGNHNHLHHQVSANGSSSSS